MSTGAIVLIALGMTLQLGVIRMLFRYWHSCCEEQRQRDEWSRQFARGLTGKRFDEWKLSQRDGADRKGGDA